MSVVLVMDIETTGLPKTMGWDLYYPYTELDKYNTSRVIQLSWALYKADGELMGDDVNDYLLHCEDINQIENTSIHGITYEKLQEEGSSWDKVMPHFQKDVVLSNMIVAHNLLFDLNVLSADMYRHGHHHVVDLLAKKDRYCTMDEGRILTNIELPSGHLKNPKLSELYHFLFQEKMKNQHNSKYDVIHTSRCFFEMTKIIKHLQG